MTEDEDFGEETGMEAFEWTDETVSLPALCVRLRRPVLRTESPLQNENGAWVTEYGDDGAFLHWRFYRALEPA